MSHHAAANFIKQMQLLCSMRKYAVQCAEDG